MEEGREAEIYMRLGILISSSEIDAKVLLQEIEKLTWRYDAKLVFSMISRNEIRLVEKPSEQKTLEEI
jgi:hypothetical protein